MVSKQLVPEIKGRLLEMVTELTHEEAFAFWEHMNGGTSADWLARTLTRAGHPIGATTLKAYRQAAREMEGGERGV